MNAMSRPKDPALALFIHELRQPLASILFAVQWMNETRGDESAIREICKIVERQSRFLAGMVDNLLEDQGQGLAEPRLHKSWFDLEIVMACAVEATAALFTKRKHHLVVSLPPEPLWVHADALRLQQVIVNLLTNAAKYTEPGGRVQLSAGITNDLVVIEVRDNGIGIAEALLPRVFDLFERGAELPGTRSSGQGIGLALVKSLVELHGGAVSVQSEGAGAGSVFVVRLPGNGSPVHRAHAGSEASIELLSVERCAETDAMGDA